MTVMVLSFASARWCVSARGTALSAAAAQSLGSIVDGFVGLPRAAGLVPSLECEPHAGGNGVRLRQIR
jgi:hypothetical protein